MFITAAFVTVTVVLTGCGSDSTTESSTQPSTQASAAPTSQGPDEYDLSFTGVVKDAANGTTLTDCQKGFFWNAEFSSSDQALGELRFEVSGTLLGDETIASADSLQASIREAGITGDFSQSVPGKGFSVSADGATVTMKNVVLKGDLGTSTVNGSMTCGS